MTNTLPTISVVTPVWNGMQFLRECVESVLSQDHCNFEMLISDDGSTDGSKEYLKSINDPRIQIFEQQTNLGIFGNLNYLFKKARAPVTQILCQDDYFISPDALTRLNQKWNALLPETGFMRCNWGADVGRCPLNRYAFQTLPNTIEPVDAALCFFVFGNIPGNLSNVSLRTQLVADAGWFRQELPYTGDFDFWSRLAQSKSLRLETENIVFVRRHSGAASVHLNTRGELVAQAHHVASSLFHTLATAYPARRLCLHATINYDSLQRNTAFSNLRRLKGPAYLKEVDKIASSSKMFFNFAGIYLVFLLSLGGRIGRVAAARSLLKLRQSERMGLV